MMNEKQTAIGGYKSVHPQQKMKIDARCELRITAECGDSATQRFCF